MYNRFGIDTSRHRRRSHRGVSSGAGLGIALIILLLVLGSCGAMRAAYSASEVTNVTATVTSKERVCSGNGDGGTSCKYLIFTDDTTYAVVDSWGILGGPTRFSSSDLYGRIQDGPGCFSLIGWRIPLLSNYQNVVSYSKGACE